MDVGVCLGGSLSPYDLWERAVGWHIGTLDIVVRSDVCLPCCQETSQSCCCCGDGAEGEDSGWGGSGYSGFCTVVPARCFD